MGNLCSSLLNRAMNRAALTHAGQCRKGGNIPYLSHPAAVALILQRAGFDEATLAAALLHDVVEDTAMTLEEVARAFGSKIAELVDALTEHKTDAAGNPLPWAFRKQVKFEKIQAAPLEAKAIALADKLHNLATTMEDLRAGHDVWPRFNAAKEPWLANVRRSIDACDDDSDPRLALLAAECRQMVRELETL